MRCSKCALWSLWRRFDNKCEERCPSRLADTLQATQLALLHAISNPSKPLRHVVGTNIAVVVVAGGLADWPELLVQMVQCLESSDANALEGALDALYKARAPYGFAHPGGGQM